MAIAGVLVLGLGMGGAQQAQATTSAAGAIMLTGTISPDPVLSDGPFSFSLNGTAIAEVGETPASCTVSFAGTLSGPKASLAGDGSLNCNGTYVTGGSFSISCQAAITLTGLTLLRASGSCSGPARGLFGATLLTQVFTTTMVAEGDFTIGISA